MRSRPRAVHLRFLRVRALVGRSRDALAPLARRSRSALAPLAALLGLAGPPLPAGGWLGLIGLAGGVACGHAQAFDEGVLHKDGVSREGRSGPARLATRRGRRGGSRVPRRRAERLRALRRAVREARRRRAAARPDLSPHHGDDRARVRRAGHHPVRRPGGAPHAPPREARRRPDAVRHLRDEERRLPLRPRLRRAARPLRRRRRRLRALRGRRAHARARRRECSAGAAAAATSARDP